MSSNSPQPPDVERIEKGVKAVTSLTNTLTEFLRWVAGMIRKRQWVELLMFMIAVAIVFWGMKLTLAKESSKEPVFYGIWFILGVIFFAGVILELKKKPPLKPPNRDIGKRKAIKFLSSFEQEDAEIFAQLQGNRDLRDISENIVRSDFNFGVLKGRSGCGKSSYLKAGLLAELAKKETYRGVYIKFSNLDSLETIREAFIDSLKLSKAEVENLNFIELLRKGIEAASQHCENFKSLILIFDQFEQFFVYTDDQARREAFIQDLATWYNNDELTDKIKILISIREDWFARMDEIQQSLNYTLRIGSQMGGNSFYLKNFSAEEATMILAVMTKEDLGIEENDIERFDSPYIQEVLERDLASPTDRLISPVDLQIIAETIKHQNTSEMRSFTRKALQRLGGIEGLRRSFLESILEDLGIERKKLALQVLVTLTNLEQQTRAEIQTLPQLQNKLQGILPPDKVEKLVTYLQEMGLISVVERDGIKGYELAHEGMISAVIRLGEQIQDKVYRANQLLERRVNEWLGNNRSSRYLFNWGELWSIEQQKPYLIWGSKRQQKQKLLERSKREIYWNFGKFGAILLLGLGIWGWLNYTPWGQLTQIRQKLADVSQQITNRERVQAVAAFAKDESFAQAFKLANQMEDSRYKADALSAIAAAIGKLNQPEKAAPLLEKALASANQMEDYEKADALSAIAAAIGKLNQPEKAAPLLEKALASANQIEDSSDKANALSAIAAAYGKLNQPEKAAPLLEKALASANQMRDSSDALSVIAEAEANLKNWGQALKVAQQCPSKDCEVESLAKVLTVYAEQVHPELKEIVLNRGILYFASDP